MTAQKGSFGYLNRKRKTELIKTILLFAVSASLLIAGIAATGSNQNLLTIVAVLGCLPASKSTVNTIMLFRYHGCSEEDQNVIAGHAGPLPQLYDLVFTSYEKNYEVHHIVLKGQTLCGYSASEKCDIKACEKHIGGLLTQNGFKNFTVKIFKDLTGYTKRLDQLSSSSSQDSGREDEILALLTDISL